MDILWALLLLGGCCVSRCWSYSGLERWGRTIRTEILPSRASGSSARLGMKCEGKMILASNTMAG